MNVTIRLENTDDQQSIWNVNQATFNGDDEAKLVDVLRDGGSCVGTPMYMFGDESVIPIMPPSLCRAGIKSS